MTAVELTITLVPASAVAVLGINLFAAARWGAISWEVLGIALSQGAAAASPAWPSPAPQQDCWRVETSPKRSETGERVEN